jgi:arabinogalactan oligomer/maltooligosaccharide transport system permease protein
MSNAQFIDAKKHRTSHVYGRRVAGDAVSYVFLTVMAIIWLLPVAWVVLESFNTVMTPATSSFFPTSYTLNNYVGLWTNDSVIPFGKQFLNTLIIAIFTCIISTAFVLAVSYSLSRLRFRFRKPYMNIVLVLGMFPAVASVVILYFILKTLGLAGTVGSIASIIGLILAYSAGTGASFYIMKGYMDTIPMSLDEAAELDGCTHWQVFTKIIIPISKPMLVYQALTSFLAPWLDFVMAQTIVGSSGADHMTVATGLYALVTKPNLATRYFPWFAAGAVCISIPIAILYLIMQRFYTESMSGSVKG